MATVVRCACNVSHRSFCAGPGGIVGPAVNPPVVAEQRGHDMHHASSAGCASSVTDKHPAVSASNTNIMLVPATCVCTWLSLS